MPPPDPPRSAAPTTAERLERQLGDALGGVRAADADTRATRLPLRVKCPNDLLASDPPRKAGGLLLEHTGGWLLAGVGINVNSTAADFPPDLSGKLTTLSTAGRKRYDVE